MTASIRIHLEYQRARSFLDGTSSTYLEELEERYRADPSSVDKTWASFFSSLGMMPKVSLMILKQDTCHTSRFL